jgi:hypothetical protein
MTTLLFKIDKKARMSSGASPNPFVNAKQLFRLYWQRITQQTDEDKTTVAAKAEVGFNSSVVFNSSYSITQVTQKADEVLSQGIKSDQSFLKVRRELNKP